MAENAMGDLYIKPGNQERGWNDPPQFSYGLQTAQGGPKRNLLNKRVPPPQLSGSQNPAPGFPPPPSVNSTLPCNPLPPPMGGVTPPPPPCMVTGPPPRGMATPPRPCPVKEHSDSPNAQSESEPNLDDVLALLNWALSACRQTVRKQVCDDVERRLKLFEEMWKGGKLSLPVQRRTNGLVQELKNGNWDTADEMHRSLMVDHVNEVSQWMVGVKRLIGETRNLSPALLGTDEVEATQSAGSPATVEQSESAGSPAAVEQSASAGSPAAVEQSASAGSPATVEQSASAGSPAAVEATQSAGSPAVVEQSASAGSPAAVEQSESAGSPAAVEATQSAGSPAAVEQSASAGSPAAVEQSESTGSAPRQ